MKQSKYDLGAIMKRAWEIKKSHKDNIFALCLKMAWEEARENFLMDAFKAYKEKFNSKHGIVLKPQVIFIKKTFGLATMTTKESFEVLKNKITSFFDNLLFEEDGTRKIKGKSFLVALDTEKAWLRVIDRMCAKLA